MRQTIGDPFDMLLNRHDYIGQNRRASWPGDEKKVGESRHHQAQVGAWPARPFFLKRKALVATDVDAVKRASHGVVTRGKHNAVKRMDASLGLDASGHDSLDWCRAQVNQADIRLVESLVIVRIDAYPLGANGMVGGCQQVCGFCIFDGTANLVPYEFGGIVIGRFVGIDVVVGMGEISPTFGPAALIFALAFLGTHIGAGVRAVVVQNSRAGCFCLFAVLCIVGFPGQLLVRCERPVPGWNAEIGRALKHHDLLGLTCNSRDALNTR